VIVRGWQGEEVWMLGSMYAWSSSDPPDCDRDHDRDYDHDRDHDRDRDRDRDDR
jgi:hypothetical protein